MFYYWHYDFVRMYSVYWGALISWVLVTAIYHLIAMNIVPKLGGDDTPDEFAIGRIRDYMGGSMLIGLWQSIVVSFLAIVTLLKGYDGLNSPSVVGAVLFYFGFVLNTFMLTSAILVANLVLLLPMLVFFITRGQLGDMAIAVFLGLLIVTVFSFSRLQRRAFISQIEQKSQLEILTHALEIEKNRAEAANQAKSHFFTSASHDARQPLQAISLLSESLIRSTHLHDQDRHLVEKIGANLHAIRNLFNRVLDISRIEGGSLQAQMQSVCLSEVFEQLSQQYSEIAAHNNLWLRFAPTDVRIWHDPEVLQRMLGNLIHNALKFTEQGGVWVGYRAQRGCIEIRDSGIGIAFEEQDKIFQDFYQLNNAERSRDTGAGVGLGLSIVSRMAQLTDTRIELRSMPQRGTVFAIYCSVCPAHSTVRLSNDVSASETSQTRLENHTDDLQGMHLLYVEDDGELRTLFTQALSAYGVQVVACASMQAMDAYLQQHRNTPVDVLLTDYRLLEGQTGIAVAQWVQRTLKRTIPTLIITGDTHIHTDPSLDMLEDVRVLQKPVQMQDLVDALRECVG